MKRILLISDSHGFLDTGLKKHIASSDEVWHAGDIGSRAVSDAIRALKTLRAVHGNIDGQDIRVDYPEELQFTCEGLKVFMTHIGGYPGRYPARIKTLLNRERPGLFICGHSHILKVINDKEFGLLHINPGACGIQGFHHMRTALRFSIEAGQIKDLVVIELGKRTA